MLWGETTVEECVATVHAAVEAGIDLFDLAPRYGDGKAERVVGEAFGGRLPAGVRVTSKCNLGEPRPAEIEGIVRRSIEGSLERLRLSRLDLFFLHSNVVPDEQHIAGRPDAASRMTLYATFVRHVRPLFERLVAEGVIGAWGLTGIGHPDTIIRLLGETPAPAAVQCIANLLDSPGGLKFFDGPAKPRAVIAAARANGVGVMGIRAVQAGALTSAIDRPLAGRPSRDARLRARRRVSPPRGRTRHEPRFPRPPLRAVARHRHAGSRRQEPSRAGRMRRRRQSRPAARRSDRPDRSVGGPHSRRMTRSPGFDDNGQRRNDTMGTAAAVSRLPKIRIMYLLENQSQGSAAANSATIRCSKAR